MLMLLQTLAQECTFNGLVFTTNSDSRVIRILKILRILRIARVLKLVKFVTCAPTASQSNYTAIHDHRIRA